jgi:hypothetical protein
VRAVIALPLSLALAGCVDGRGPRLTMVTPEAAGHGARVMLAGEHLCGATANCATAGGEVQIGLNPPIVIAPVIEYSDTAAVIEIPSLAEVGPSKIVVTVNESASNALDFEVLP